MFAATLNVIVPLPIPVAPVPTVIHESAVVDVHSHPGVVVTDTELFCAPFLLNESLVGLMEYEHPEACDTANVFPVMLMLPVRAGPVFASTV